MIATISTILDTSAERAWEALKRSATFLYVTRGLLGLRLAEPLPEEWRADVVVHARLLFFHCVPGWVHELRVVRVDERQRELYTNEGGGPMPTWNHRITVACLADTRCRYTDAVEIGAGRLTPLVWMYAHFFFRYRQFRLRRLARTLT